MHRTLSIFFITYLISLPSIAATEGEEQATSFANIYASLCLKYISHLDELREKLKPMPQLPPEKAALFLSGSAGDVWPVPDKHGTFVLALPTAKNVCLVYARRADTEAAKAQFARFVATAPSPLTAKKAAENQQQTSSNGLTQTTSYEWSVPGANRKLLFTLTTASSESAQLQVLGSAAVVSQ